MKKSENVQTVSKHTVAKQPGVIIETIFRNEEYGFTETIESVVSVRHLRAQISEFSERSKEDPFHEHQVHSDLRYHLVNPCFDEVELFYCNAYYTCGFNEMTDFLEDHPNGGFKVIVHIDMTDFENSEIECMEPKKLDKTDKTTVRLLDHPDSVMKVVTCPYRGKYGV